VGDETQWNKIEDCEVCSVECLMWLMWLFGVVWNEVFWGEGSMVNISFCGTGPVPLEVFQNPGTSAFRPTQSPCVDPPRRHSVTRWTKNKPQGCPWEILLDLGYFGAI
jgi:hypothetical protein